LADDNEALEKCEMPKEKDDKRKECHKKTMKRVAAYIGLMMLQWQD
jgi:hypothetical protein